MPTGWSSAPRSDWRKRAAAMIPYAVLLVFAARKLLTKPKPKKEKPHKQRSLLAEFAFGAGLMAVNVETLVLVVASVKALVGSKIGVGEEALVLWNQGGYDLVLADLQMPTMDGFELARNIRGIPFPPSCTFRERLEAERLSVGALLDLDGDLKGDYYPLNGSTR